MPRPGTRRPAGKHEAQHGAQDGAAIDRESFKTPLDEADVRMYEHKKRAHAMRSAS